MKKEILCSVKRVDLSFFYDSKIVSAKEEKEYKEWLTNFCLAVDWLFSQKELKNIFKEHKIKKVYLNLNLVSDYKIKKLNFLYRQKNKITDVLSFPMQEEIREGHLDVFNGELELGDLFICKSVCLKQALEFKLTYFEEFVHLAGHGVLHLLGFDHEISEEEEKLMEKLEEKIIKKISTLFSKN